MLKKIFSILFFIAISSSVNCMQYGETPNFFGILDDIHPRLAKELNNLIAQKKQDELIRLLQQNHDFVGNNLSFFLKIFSEQQLDEVINYLKQAFTIDHSDLLECAINLGDIMEIKNLTEFDNYIEGETFQYDDFYRSTHLSLEILDEIIIHNKINYICFKNKTRYLQAKIPYINEVNTILRFIGQAPAKQLNARNGILGETALHVAAIAWDKNYKAQDNIGMQNREAIIKALLQNGANPQIADWHGTKAVDLNFFTQNKKLCEQWQATYRSSRSRTQRFIGQNKSSNNVKPKYMRNKSSNSFFKIAALSAIGVVAFYLCYRPLSKTNSNKIMKMR